MKTILIAILTSFGLSTSFPAIAQQEWSTEFRTGISFPIDDLGDIALDPGFGVEGTLAYRISPLLSAYAGWGWRQFDADTPNGDPDVEQTGYSIGVQVTSGVGKNELAYRARVGLTYEHIEIENARGDTIEDTDHGVGFELGGALIYALSDQLSFIPEVRYRFLSRDVDFVAADDSVDLSYITLDLGMAWAF